MSHRKCKDCRRVINNRHWSKPECPKCGSTNMCDPNEHNNDWDELCKLQDENYILKAKLELIHKHSELK